MLTTVSWANTDWPSHGRYTRLNIAYGILGTYRQEAHLTDEEAKAPNRKGTRQGDTVQRLRQNMNPAWCITIKLIQGCRGFTCGLGTADFGTIPEMLSLPLFFFLFNIFFLSLD